MSTFRFLLRLFRYDVKYRFRSPSGGDLSSEEKRSLDQLSQEGLFVTEALLPAADVEKYRAEIEGLLEARQAKIWVDRLDSDHRIYGANALSGVFDSYLQHPLIVKMLEYYQKSRDKSGFTMAAKMVYKPNNPGSGDGWHRDSCDQRQTKSLAYLTDVTSATGPFQYVKHSHRLSYIVRDWLRYGIHPMQSRVTEEKINRLLAREPERLVEVTGKAGDVLFADTRGLHRGKPIQKDLRIAMTNYYWFDSEIPESMRSNLQNALQN